MKNPPKRNEFHLARYGLVLALCGAVMAACSPREQGESGAATERIITLGAMPAETVIALGAGDRLVGMDQSASPFSGDAPAAKLLNYHRQTSSEGVLSLRPSHLILTDAAGPSAAIEQLKETGLQWVQVSEPRNWQEVVAGVDKIGEFIGRAGEADRVIAEMNARKAEADRLLETFRGKADPPRVLFVMSAGNSGTLLCAGTESGADAVIRMAGAQNAATGFVGYKPISSEALVELNPDVVLFPVGGAHGGDRMDQILRNHDGLKNSKAVADNGVHGVDMVRMLGFGPSLAPQLVELVQLFYAQAAPEESQAAVPVP